MIDWNEIKKHLADRADYETFITSSGNYKTVGNQAARALATIFHWQDSFYITEIDAVCEVLELLESYADRDEYITIITELNLRYFELENKIDEQAAN